MVDLSAPIGPGTVVYPGDPAPRLSVHSTIAKDGFNLLAVSMGSHTGTHVDAPYHFVESAPRIDQLDLELFAGRAVVLDATSVPARSPITTEHVDMVADRLESGVIVLVHTGWSSRYGEPAYFDHPYLDTDACRQMLDRGVRTFCIDTINIDETPDDDHPGVGFPVHHLIADAHGVIGENFRNFDQVAWADPFVFCLPILLEGADGAPVRAVAVELTP